MVTDVLKLKELRGNCSLHFEDFHGAFIYLKYKVVRIILELLILKQVEIVLTPKTTQNKDCINQILTLFPLGYFPTYSP